MENTLEWVEKTDQLVTIILTFMIAAAAIVSTFITYFLARDNRILRKAGTEPYLIAYILPDSRYISVTNFYIMNTGKGPAKEINFDVLGNYNQLEKSDLKLNLKKNKTPISVLPPGESIHIFFGMAHNLLKEPKLEPVEIKLTYRNGLGKLFEENFVLDITQFEGFSWIGKTAEDDIAENIKKIEGHMMKLISGTVKTRVIADSPEGWRKEAKREKELNKNKGK